MRLRARLPLLACLLALTVAPATIDAGDDPATKLARYAQALRSRPSEEAYGRLEKFARQHRGTELGARAALRLGLADFEQQRWVRAEEQFSRAMESSLLGDYGRFYLAQTQRHRGAFEQALATLMEFHLRHADSRLAEAAQTEQAALLVQLGHAGEAKTFLSSRPDWERRPGLLFALARAQAAAGEVEAAVETLHRIYYEFPLSPEAEPSSQLLSQLRPQLGSRYTPPSEAMRLARAERLWEAQAYQGARSSYLDLSVRASEPTRRLARLRAAQVLQYLAGSGRACGELEAIREVGPEYEAEWLAFRAQCRLRANDLGGFERELESLGTHSPGSRWHAQVLFTAGGYWFAADDLARARSYFERLLQQIPETEWAVESHWRLAWIAYLEQDWARAARTMEGHLRRFPGSRFTPQVLYWRARIAERSGEGSVATRLSELLRVHFPRHYLGQQVSQVARARDRGGASGEENSAPLPAWVEEIRLTRPLPNAPPVPEALARLLERAQALEELGLFEFAAEEAALALENASHPEASLARARAAFALRQYAAAIEWIRRGLPNYLDFSLDDLSPATWQLLFPRLYWDSIQRHARRNRLDPYLVAALMRQESRFEPKAVSSAGAHGLMQLMPDTARKLAGVRRLNADRLFEPEFNIRLGTRFLRELRERFRGRLELMVAAYNAGGTRVEQWHRRRAWAEPAEFVESIPVAQTRDFVYLVLRNYQFYRDLYADEKTR